MCIVKATFVELKEGVSPLYGITEQEIIDEIRTNEDVKSLEIQNLKTSNSNDFCIEIPIDLSSLNISTKLKNLLEKYKGKKICITMK